MIHEVTQIQTIPSTQLSSLPLSLPQQAPPPPPPPPPPSLPSSTHTKNYSDSLILANLDALNLYQDDDDTHVEINNLQNNNKFIFQPTGSTGDSGDGTIRNVDDSRGGRRRRNSTPTSELREEDLPISLNDILDTRESEDLNHENKIKRPVVVRVHYAPKGDHYPPQQQSSAAAHVDSSQRSHLMDSPQKRPRTESKESRQDSPERRFRAESKESGVPTTVLYHRSPSRIEVNGDYDEDDDSKNDDEVDDLPFSNEPVNHGTTKGSPDSPLVALSFLSNPHPTNSSPHLHNSSLPPHVLIPDPSLIASSTTSSHPHHHHHHHHPPPPPLIPSQSSDVLIELQHTNKNQQPPHSSSSSQLISGRDRGNSSGGGSSGGGHTMYGIDGERQTRKGSVETGPQCCVKDCRQTYSSNQELLFHMKSTHPSENELFYCPTCTQHFSLGFGWEKHQTTRIHLRSLGSDQAGQSLLRGKVLKSSEDEHEWLLLTILRTVFVTLILYILTALASCGWSIYLGFTSFSLPCEKNLSLWLRVYGITMSVVNILYFFGLLKIRRSGIKSLSPKSPLECCIIFLFLWDISWLIVGSIWIYSISFYTHLCSDIIFQTVFYTISISWGCLLLFFLFIISLVLYAKNKK